MNRPNVSITERINEIRYADENREALRAERILAAKREAGRLMAEAGCSSLLVDVKNIVKQFSGSEVQSITLHGKTIFALEAPIAAQFKKQPQEEKPVQAVPTVQAQKKAKVF